MSTTIITGAVIQGSTILGFVYYRYYRWEISNVRGGPTGSSSSYPQASEFVFRFNSINQSMSGVTVTNPGGSNPASETPPKLVDGNTGTKFLDLNTLSSRNTIVIFDFGSGNTKRFNGYNWATANDVTSRDPRTWTISGSNDNSNWTVLHTVTDFFATASRNTYNIGWSF